MKNLNQWINWRLLPPEPPSVKPRKVPHDLTTGQKIDPHNPAVWLSYAEAARRDPQHVGIVLTDNDPYFCIDLDHAWDGARWSDLAASVVGMFPGAYVEVSYSGDGLHIIGRGTPPAGYGTRGPGVELYSHGRFIAITGRHATGNPDTDHTAALATFANLYLKPADAATPAEWSTAPVAGYTGPDDDDALITKAMNARASAAVAFGGKASFPDLWQGNVAALADAWPSQTDAYDRSAADAALGSVLIKGVPLYGGM